MASCSLQGQLFDVYPTLVHDESVYQTLTGFTAGVDEVGRGPLIGDVVACAVILPKGCDLPLRDSKKLNEKTRERLALEIESQAVGYCIARATFEEIDELNILHATLLAMRRAVSQLHANVSDIRMVYVDGNRCPKLTLPCQSVIKGDDKILEISAASILAKVYRDRQMIELHERYPHYGFADHKGYPTVKHLAALAQYGLIEGYRKSFKPVRDLSMLSCTAKGG
ncbi:ribonuclease HII [Thiomicrorhabdus aquaedulcis]|uniref:ribonuclease HII n=1 Tax=Thiomicrorhabdus aquaedulcis TaxID=2211106 RepID=UPI000FDC1C59|nr:ribonuclease HII [Thiomicrorhabdus aquaedulcis]